MAEVTNYNPGEFCWIDIATMDMEAAKAFYSELFGWVPKQEPVETEFPYVIFHIEGKPVAGMGKLMDEQIEQGVPPYWMPYVSTNNIEALYARIPELGGQVIMPVMDIMEEGKMGVLQDSEGGMLALWEPKNHKGFAFKDIHGTFCWAEYGSHDRSIPVPFLEKLFGWSSDTKNMGGMDYTTFSMGDKMIGGLYQMPAEMANVPPHWLSYFKVDDMDVSLEKLTKMNGKILMPKTFIEGVGYFAVVQDNQEAVFGLLQ